MKRLFIGSVILTFTLMSFIENSFTDYSGHPSYKSKKNQKAGIKLFNGKNLDGWYTFIKGKGKNNDPNNVFTVKNGLIRISGEEFGCITTNEEFENYSLWLSSSGENLLTPPEWIRQRIVAFCCIQPVMMEVIMGHGCIQLNVRLLKEELAICWLSATEQIGFPLLVLLSLRNRKDPMFSTPLANL